MAFVVGRDEYVEGMAEAQNAIVRDNRSKDGRDGDIHKTAGDT